VSGAHCQTLWNLESLVRSKREQLCSIKQQAGYCNNGSKDCCINNLILLSIILIYSTVKDLVLSHFDLVRDPRCFLNHKLVFKLWTQCQIKMTHKLIKNPMTDHIDSMHCRFDMQGFSTSLMSWRRVSAQFPKPGSSSSSM
jgi:hypothetical protein